jgi:L-ascorbate metabolism protein UlaG (beta-lactamase superfamily)
MMTNPFLNKIHWLGHASFRIDGETATIYLDPWQLSGDQPKADLILITHDHHDHCSPEDVAKIMGAGTVIVTVAESVKKLKGNIRVVKPGDLLTVNGVDILAVPAYNLTKFRSPGVTFHPKEMGFVGFIVTVDGQRIYHAGDTDIIPEMSEYQADIALLPVSGTYVMTAEEAAEAAGIIKPGVMVPMHVGRGIGSEKDLETIQAMSPVPVKVLEFEGK